MSDEQTHNSFYLHPSECDPHQWQNKTLAQAQCYMCGLKRPRTNRFARYDTVHKHEGEWKYLFFLCSAFGTGNAGRRDEEIRCKRSGQLEIWRPSLKAWVDSSFFELNRCQMERIRSRCWGGLGLHQNPTFSHTSEVPRLVKGERFTISGCPEQDGYYVCRYYDERGMVVRKLLPDYWCIAPQYRIKNEPWPE